MRRPLVAIVACLSDRQGDPVHAVSDRYVRPVAEQAGADVVVIPALGALADASVLGSRIDGLLLGGSPSNVEPARYGSSVSATGPFDTARDSTSLTLITAMVAAAKPVFGICRGLQEINVAFGGTLRHIGPTPLHHAATETLGPAMFEHRHPVRLSSGGALREAAGADWIEVNSVHYQTIDKLGDGLVVEACAADGVIEAIAAVSTPAPVFAVQWHPEWDANAWEGSSLFFTAMRQALGTT